MNRKTEKLTDLLDTNEEYKNWETKATCTKCKHHGYLNVCNAPGNIPYITPGERNQNHNCQLFKPREYIPRWEK